jgi:hypothetical protein
VAQVVRSGVGAVLALVGLVWIGQGSGLIPGSFMTGQGLWLGLGVLCLLLGVGILALPRIRRSTRRP